MKEKAAYYIGFGMNLLLIGAFVQLWIGQPRVVPAKAPTAQTVSHETPEPVPAVEEATPSAAEEASPTVLVAIPKPTSPAPVTPVTDAPGTLNGQVASLVNSYRLANGLTALYYDYRLQQSATVKANDICDRQYWSHYAPDGTTPWTLIMNAGYRYAQAGENLAKMGSDSPSDTVEAWKASPGHNALMLTAEYEDIGVGYVACSDGTFIFALHAGVQ